MAHVINWTNPTTNDDGTPYDGETMNAGYELRLDGVGAVSLPLRYGTTFDMATLAAFASLKNGNHTVALAVVTKDGGRSEYSNAVTFPLDRKPTAPTAVGVA